MIYSTNSLIALLLLVVISGCNILGGQQKTKYVEPKLPAAMSCQDLIDHLNRQSHGLHAWRCTDTLLTARMPNGIPLRLSANIACAAPNQFRLRASNLVADVDLGANKERCWFYAKPGQGQVMTWRHEDSELLQHVAIGVPRIDPDWLMVVLGVMPLQASDFDVSSGPAGSTELWLTSITDDFNGRPLRRVIKVDTISGRVREHVIYDHERSPLIRATLKDHRTIQGYLIPRTVRLEFPAMDTELTLKFGKIETNCAMADALWCLPNHRNVQVVDLGNAIRAQLNQNPSAQTARLGNQQHQDTSPFSTASAGANANNSTVIDGTPVTGRSNLNSEHRPAPDFSQTYLHGVSMESADTATQYGSRETATAESFDHGFAQFERPNASFNRTPEPDFGDAGFGKMAFENPASEPPASDRFDTGGQYDPPASTSGSDLMEEAPEWDLPPQPSAFKPAVPQNQPAPRRGWSMNWRR